MKSHRAAMLFEWIRRIEPCSARPQPQPEPEPSRGDAPELAELVATARAHTGLDEPSLACPIAPAQCIELPRFAGVSLADVALEPPRPPAPRSAAPVESPRDITAPLPPRPRVLLGPGAMTMTLAIVATLVFGVFVATT